MSSPTKLGAYLAAGLHIISLSGIAVINRLSKEHPNSFDIFEETNFKKNLSKKNLEKIIMKISDPYISINSRKLAKDYFDISIAKNKYKELYDLLIKK